MKRLLSLILLLIITVVAEAQVTVEAKIDSIEILIGEQTCISVQVTMNKGSRLEMPDMENVVLTPGVEVLSTSPADTTEIENNKLVVKRVYRVTSFDQHLYYLPPFNVKVDGKQYKSKSLALKVVTVEVDTIHKDKFFGLKDVVDNPFSWSDWSIIFWLSVFAVILLSISYYLYTRYRDNKPIIRHIKIINKLLPHQRAMKEIEQIKAEKIWASDNSKEYYTKLTDTLRKYIEERYGFNAMEMTSAEIIANLKKLNDEKAINELRELFQTADLVKFAKYNTLINENDMNLVNAIEFINNTKIEVNLDAKKIKPELSSEEKRGRKASIVLKWIIFVLVASSVTALAYVVWNSFELLR
jgi:hypothetical protein